MIKQVAKEAITLDDNRKQFKQKDNQSSIKIDFELLLGLSMISIGVSSIVMFWGKGFIYFGGGFFILTGLYAIKRSNSKRIFKREH